MGYYRSNLNYNDNSYSIPELLPLLPVGHEFQLPYKKQE